MITVKELSALNAALKPDELRRQLGPFVLVQRPPKDERPRRAVGAGPEDPTNPWREPEPTSIARSSAIADGTLGLLFQFDSLTAATLPPLRGVDELSVGRQPDCDLVIADASVSKRHATLRWDAKSARATVQDLDSTNGTFLNAGARLERETTLHDGDIISFGEVQFWYLLTETLLDRLNPSASKLPRGV